MGRAIVYLFTVQQISEYDIDVHEIFVNFKLFYGGKNHSPLYKRLLQFGITVKLVQSIKLTMVDTIDQNALTDLYFSI